MKFIIERSTHKVLCQIRRRVWYVLRHYLHFMVKAIVWRTRLVWLGESVGLAQVRLMKTDRLSGRNRVSDLAIEREIEWFSFELLQGL